MLQSLYVKNMALIDEVQVDFQRGLNILTGETGAGKSIIIGSIALALGGRFQGDMVRKGASYGLVELRFLIDHTNQKHRLGLVDVFPDEDVVTISRKFMDGRSTTKINGETVSLSLVKKVASILIHMYGQAEHHVLLSTEQHLQILDDYLGEKISSLKEKVKVDFHIKEEAKKALLLESLGEEERRREVDFLSYEIAEIDDANLKENEDIEVEAAYKKMNNAKKIKEAVYETYENISGSSSANASNYISRAIRAFSDVSSFDSQTEGIKEQLLDLEGLLNDCSRELAIYTDTLEFSKEEFTEVENRINEINHLKSKYGRTIADILEVADQKRERLQFLDNYEENVAKLKRDYEKAKECLRTSADLLSKARIKGAPEFSKELEKGVQELTFNEVTFVTKFTEFEEPTENGAEEAAFYISMNTGIDVAPLSYVVSGGELSRIMLAVKTLLAKREGIETLVFDEIDTGISGRTAQKVADKMAQLAKNTQIICITHLAQIAAMANTHFVIEKEVIKGETKTFIKNLSEEESIEELSRILGGEKITDTVRANAREMKNLNK